MLSPIFVVLLAALAYYQASNLLKFRKYIYPGVWIFVVLGVVLADKPFMLPLTKGYLGFAFWYVVMMTGAINPKWKLTAKLKAVRGVYSVMGFILLLPHPLRYAAEVLSAQREFPIFGVVAFAIMVPLFITSYMVIRTKMKATDWKKLQSLAYISYGLIFIHLIVRATTPINRILAIVMGIIYVGLKIQFELNKRSLKHTA